MKKLLKKIEKGLSSMALIGITFYKNSLSSIFGGTCRFYPTCSCYGKEAFEKHSFWRAFWLTSKRVLKCVPFGPKGYDPVPPAESAPQSREVLDMKMTVNLLKNLKIKKQEPINRPTQTEKGLC